jgi:Tol biopolymer transport system component
VRRLPGKHGGVYALRSEIDEWQRNAGHSHRRRFPKAVLLAAAALSLATGGSWWMWRSTPSEELRIHPLASIPGDERWPVFSPDGRRIAFGWRREGAGEYDLCVLDNSKAYPAPIAYSVHAGPAWSNDGNWIAFERVVQNGRKMAVVLVPASGGKERVVTEVSANLAGRLYPQIAWVKDDQSLIVADRDGPGEPFRLVRISLADGSKSTLTRPPPGYRGDQAPVLSRDGRTLAFIRLRTVLARDLWELDLSRAAGAEPKRITSLDCCVSNPAWYSSGKELLALVNEYDQLAIRSIGHPPGRAPLFTLLPVCSSFSTAPDGRIVYSTSRYNEDIWRIGRDGGSPPDRVARSTRNEEMPSLSRDGSALAFASDRSGSYEIWTASSNGSGLFRVTSSGKGDVLTPRWSPDGAWIAYECGSGICLTSPRGGSVVEITGSDHRNTLPSWSRDGKRLYFASDRSGRFEVWKVAVSPQGVPESPVQVTRLGGHGGYESPDGKVFYYARWEQAGEIWSVPVDGGAESPLPVPLAYHQRPENFHVARSGIYSKSWLHSEGSFELLFWPWGATQVSRVAKIHGMPGTGLTMPEDESYLLYSALDHEPGDLMIIDKSP